MDSANPIDLFPMASKSNASLPCVITSSSSSSGGDLHTLRQRQPGKYFSEQAVKAITERLVLLLRGLLVKEPQHRLAYKRGATEIKQHPFFQGLNWALIRCATPPEIPKPVVIEKTPPPPASSGKAAVAVDNNKGSHNYLEFDFF